MLSPSPLPSTACSSSRFLGLRVTPPPRSPASAVVVSPLSPSSPSPLRSPVICAAYASAAAPETAYAPASPTRQGAVPSSLYDVLGIPAGASGREIKAAYRRLALERHPDVGAPADEFIRIHSAYSTLSDPDKRAEYDRALVIASRPTTFAGGVHGWARPATPGRGGGGGGGGSYRTYTRSSSFPGQRRRTWETDQCW